MLLSLVLVAVVELVLSEELVAPGGGGGGGANETCDESEVDDVEFVLETVVELVLSEELVAPGGGGGGGGANETCDESEVDDVESLADVKSAMKAVRSVASWLSSALKLVADDELEEEVVVADDADASD
ncbi:MAG: hypothetical protein ABSA13_05235 [Beijerinckiaceae bacterium]|jgi:hypothetical protein